MYEVIDRISNEDSLTILVRHFSNEGIYVMVGFVCIEAIVIIHTSRIRWDIRGKHPAPFAATPNAARVQRPV